MSASNHIIQCHKMDEDGQEQAQLLKGFFGQVEHYFDGFGKLYEGVDDPRNPNQITYSLASELFTGVWMFVCHLGARRQINNKFRGNGRAERKFKAIFGVEEIPHGDAINYSYKRLDVEQVQEVVCGMIESLIRKKVLYRWRLEEQYFLIAIDGSGVLTFREKHCEHCLTRKLKGGKTLYYHPVLEAKLVTANGMALSVMSEFIENDDPEASKQDCELKAFYRLSERLKARFPRLPICLLLDGLFANGPVMGRCEKNNWAYMIILKDGDLKTVNRTFERLCEETPENRKEVKLGRREEIKQDYRWINEIAYVDTEKNKHTISVLECVEHKPDSKAEIVTSKFKWLTNLKVTKANANVLANEGGRLRWKVENEGFNAQKNGGFELEHVYSKDETAMKVFYFMLQIAHILYQLYEKSSLFRRSFPNGVGSLRNIGFRLLEAWRNLQVSAQEFTNLFGGRFQIRFDSS